MVKKITDERNYRAHVDFSAKPATIPVACEDCSWKGVASELNEIQDCSLTPGDPSPAGRCPKCDTLAYVVKPDLLAILNEIELALCDHPDVNVGNSKVHFAYMKAKGAK